MPSTMGLDAPTMETYSGHVKTPQDAIILFEACRIGLLPRVQRRLSEKERQLIKSGSVFVWDEREAGMRRWTDGKSWSASRVNGSFLTYREMEGKRTGGSSNNGHSPGRDGAENDSMAGDGPDGYRYKPDGLTKQSFSITTSDGRHLHLISYFSRSHAASGQLQQPTADAALRHVRPERGMYPESTLADHTNTPAMTRSPMTNMNPRYAMDGSPHQPLTAASTPQYAQPRHYDPYRNRDPYAQPWPPSPMHTPPMNGTPYGAHHYSPRYSGGQSVPGSAVLHHSPLGYSAHSTQSAYSAYPYHHREVAQTTAFDRMPQQMSNGAGLPPPPSIPTYIPVSYAPPPPAAYAPPTSAPSHYPPPPTSHPTSHPNPYISSSGPTPPESNTLPPFLRRGPSPLRERSNSKGSSPKEEGGSRRGTPPVSELPSIDEKGRQSPHRSEPRKGMIPSINALINQTPPPDAQSHSQETRKHSPPEQDRKHYSSPYQQSAKRPGLGSRSGSFHGSESGDPQASSGRSRPLDDTNALRRLDGAFAANR